MGTKNNSIKDNVKFMIDRERQAELIALTDVLKLECNRTSLSKLERYEEGLQHLLTKEKLKQKDSTNILLGIKSLLSRLPLTGGKGQFTDQMLKDYSHSQLYAYLGALTESSVMLANTSLATQQTQRKFGGYGGVASRFHT